MPEQEESLAEWFSGLSKWGKAGVAALGIGALGVTGAFLAIAGSKKPTQTAEDVFAQNTPAAVASIDPSAYRFDDLTIITRTPSGRELHYHIGDATSGMNDAERAQYIQRTRHAFEEQLGRMETILHTQLEARDVASILALSSDPDDEDRQRITIDELTNAFDEQFNLINSQGIRTRDEYRVHVLEPLLRRHSAGNESNAYLCFPSPAGGGLINVYFAARPGDDAPVRSIETIRYTCSQQRIENALSWERISEGQGSEILHSLRIYAGDDATITDEDMDRVEEGMHANERADNRRTALHQYLRR